MERMIPQILKATPAVETAAEQEAAKTKTTARAENTQEGHCPVCAAEGRASQMRPLVANGHDVLGCMDHSIFMPVRT